jgi:hypothetical protein
MVGPTQRLTSRVEHLLTRKCLHNSGREHHVKPMSCLLYNIKMDCTVVSDTTNEVL